jgi:hypothetical protein
MRDARVCALVGDATTRAVNTSRLARMCIMMRLL